MAVLLSVVAGVGACGAPVNVGDANGAYAVKDAIAFATNAVVASKVLLSPADAVGPCTAPEKVAPDSAA